MATTYTADNAAAGKQARAGVGLQSVSSKYTMTAALVINDVIKMCKVPAGAVIQDIILSTSDLDTASSPAVTLSVGDGSDTDRFLSASTIGQAGGIARLTPHLGHGYQYAAEDTIDILVAAAPTTSVTDGTLMLTVFYNMNDDV